MSHEWKIGDWCRLGGKRYFVYRVTEKVFAVPFEGGMNEIMFDQDDTEVVHLPECTGWDWKPPKPIEPPPGYRLLDNKELVEWGDWRLLDESCLVAGWNMSSYYGETAGEQVSRFRDEGVLAYARKIEPQYRPFANAAEYEPFFDKVIARSEMGVIEPGGWRPIGYSDIGIYPDVSVMDYAYAFKCLKFKDGTPFGVPVNVEA